MCTSPLRTEWDSARASNIIKGVNTHTFCLTC